MLTLLYYEDDTVMVAQFVSSLSKLTLELALEVRAHRWQMS